jgi:hypothetical protein
LPVLENALDSIFWIKGNLDVLATRFSYQKSCFGINDN